MLIYQEATYLWENKKQKTKKQDKPPIVVRRRHFANTNICITVIGVLSITKKDADMPECFLAFQN